MRQEDEQDGAWVIVLAMPKGGNGALREWHSESVECDAPGLPAAVHDVWFAELQGKRQQHVAEMAALIQKLRAEKAALRKELMEMHGMQQEQRAEKADQ